MTKGTRYIELLEYRFGYFPKRFQWHGRRYDVLGVKQVWCVVRQWPKVVRWRIFSVVTRDGPCELAHNLVQNTWELRRPPACPVSTYTAQRGLSHGDKRRAIMVR